MTASETPPKYIFSFLCQMFCVKFEIFVSFLNLKASPEKTQYFCTGHMCPRTASRPPEVVPQPPGPEIAKVNRWRLRKSVDF